MATNTWAILPKQTTATQIVNAGDGPTLITNTDLKNTVFLGDTDVIRVTDSQGIVPLGPNGSVVVDGKSDLFAVNGNSTTVVIATLTGGLANFLGLTAGGGALAIPSIFSPNFIHSISGWAINQDGSAEFNNLAIRGTFSGTNFILNSSGIFFYSGVPALGNLIVSIATAAGSDSFGNAYPQGLDVTEGQISGTDYIINTAGAFFYSAAPAHGNLIVSIAGVAGTDAFGNNYPQGINVTTGTISGVTISGSTFLVGNDIIINSNGFFVYSGVPALNNLIASWAPVAGTDSFGNTYQAGIWIYDNFGNAIGMVPGASGSASHLEFAPGTGTPSVLPSNSALYASSGGALQVRDGTDTATYAIQRRTLVTAANQLCNSGTFATFISTGVAANPSVNRTYRVKARITINPNQAAGGLAVKWTCANAIGPGIMNITWYDSAGTALAPVIFSNALKNTSIQPGFTMTNAHQYIMDLEGTFSMLAGTSDTFAIQFATPTVGDNYTVLAGSWLEMMPV